MIRVSIATDDDISKGNSIYKLVRALFDCHASQKTDVLDGR